ncbi:MAG: rod shape-determining protein MreD [Syntrophomonadaceae bacterium]|nr:rod shape-determining protein MreD [Syntrophomonadaceae bacterium]MDH7497760.1 rod shape-determining protein MreD [Syntrophomonadaceae bacterium]
MRYVCLALLPLLAFVAEGSLLSRLGGAVPVPDLVLMLVAFFAILNGSRPGAVYGFLCGLLEDLLLGRFIGLNALALAAVGYLVGRGEGKVFGEKLAVGLASFLAASAVNAAVLVVLLPVASGDWTAVHPLLRALPGQAAAGAVLALPAYAWYHRSHRRGWLRPDHRGRPT